MKAIFIPKTQEALAKTQFFGNRIQFLLFKEVCVSSLVLVTTVTTIQQVFLEFSPLTQTLKDEKTQTQGIFFPKIQETGNK